MTSLPTVTKSNQEADETIASFEYGQR